MDLKLGKIIWGRDYSEEAKLRRKKKSENTTSHSLGFRIAGYLLRNQENEVIKQGGRGFDVGLDEEGVKELMRSFFLSD